MTFSIESTWITFSTLDFDFFKTAMKVGQDEQGTRALRGRVKNFKYSSIKNIDELVINFPEKGNVN